MSAINTRIDPLASDIAAELSKVLAASGVRIDNLVVGDFSEARLRQIVRDRQTKYELALTDGTWKTSFRGRDILKRLVAKTAKGVNYEVFRNLLVARMRDALHKPAGMERVLNQIAS